MVAPTAGPRSELLGRTVPNRLRSSLALRRMAVLAVGLVALHSLRRPLAELASSITDLRGVSVSWLTLMVVAEVVSFACMWAFTRLLLPQLSWFVAATSQLASNSISRLLPGGGAVGCALFYRMLSLDGVATTEVASAMVATTVVSYAILFGVPALAALAVVAGVPVPPGMGSAVAVGGVVFALLMLVSMPMVVSPRPLRVVGSATKRALAAAGRVVGRTWALDPELLVAERARLIEVLSSRWPAVVALALGNWAFDYLALLAGLYGVGATPGPITVVLAFTAASVLAMVPLTPGGIGFVEVGLYSTLVVAGVGPGDAAVATVAYRIVSWWLPVVAGGAAWLVFRARYR